MRTGLSLPPSLLPLFRSKRTRGLDDSPSITGSARILMPPRRNNRRGKEVGSMLEAAQEAEGRGCEPAGRVGRLPSASIIPAVKSRPTALPLPMLLQWLAGNAQTVPCVVGGRVRGEMHTRSEGGGTRRSKRGPLHSRSRREEASSKSRCQKVTRTRQPLTNPTSETPPTTNKDRE
jgi:hypothetical protein